MDSNKSSTQVERLSAPLVAGLEAWMRAQRAKLSRGNDVAKAFDYMLKRWTVFTRFLDDGRICLSNNAAERGVRGIALGRKSWLFCGSDEGTSYCSSHHVLINAGYFVGDCQAAGVVTGAHGLHYGRTRTPSQL